MPPPPATWSAASSSARPPRGYSTGRWPRWSASSTAPPPAPSRRSPPVSSSPNATASTCGKRPTTAARPSPRPCASGRPEGEAAVSAEPISPTPTRVPSGSPAPATQGPGANGQASLSLAGTNGHAGLRGGVYLLHFEQRYEHAGHYTGHADDFGIRVTEQASGDSRAARLLQVITQAGIGFRLASVWPGASKAYERSLKNSGGASRYCPICQQERKARGEFRRAPRGRGERRVGPSTRMPRADQARADGHQPGGTGPTRRVRPEQVREFMALNPAFARPVSASLAKQWGRVRGREEIETLTPRVVGARFEENELLSQQRAAAITKRAVQARVQARQRQLADQAEQARTRAIAARAHQRLANAGRERAGGRAAPRGRSRPPSHRREGGHER